jgi:hypothetical protein
MFPDMIHMIPLSFQPSCIEWLHQSGSASPIIAVADADSPLIRIYEVGERHSSDACAACSGVGPQTSDLCPLPSSFVDAGTQF